MYGLLGGWVSEWVGQCLGLYQITKYQINLELIKIIQFCLKIYDLWRHPHLLSGYLTYTDHYQGWGHSLRLTATELTSDHGPVCMCHCILFGINPHVTLYHASCLYCRTLWVGVWVVGWMGGLIGRVMGGSGQIIRNWINLELINIIQFCLKIYDLWRHRHLWVGIWGIGALMGVVMSIH